MPTERSSQTARPTTREREETKSALLIYAERAPTGSNNIYAWQEEVLVNSIRAAHPIFLRLYIQLITDPGQRVDGFGQN